MARPFFIGIKNTGLIRENSYLKGMCNMATETAEKTEKKSFTPVVYNEVDDPNNLSSTTVSALPETVDKEMAEAIAKDDTATSEPKKAVREEEEKATSEPVKKEKKSEESLEEPTEKPAWYQKRFNEMTRKRREAESALEAERNKRLAIEQELEKVKNKATVEGKPKQEDYTTEEEYLDALTDWKIDNKLKTTKEKVEKETKEHEQSRIFRENIEILSNKLAEVDKKYPGTEEILTGDDFQISEAMVDAIMLSDNDIDLFNYLAKNPDISVELASMHPIKAAKEIGKIEAKLNMPPPKPRQTSAPEPITPIKTGGSIERDPSNMSFKEYKAWREKKI